MESPHDRGRHGHEKPSDATATLITIADAKADQREYTTAHELLSLDDPRGGNGTQSGGNSARQ